MNYEVITTRGQAEYAVLSRMEQSFSFDVETSGLSFVNDRLLGLSLCFEDGYNCYIVLEHTIDSKPLCDDGTPNTYKYISPQELVDVVQPIFSQEDVHMVAHNMKFDFKFLKKAGLEFNGCLYDTMLAAKMLDDGSKSLGLKELSMRVLGVQMNHYQDLTHYEGFRPEEFLSVPLNEAATYALHDTEMTWKLFEHQLPKLIEEGVDKPFFRIWMKMLPILAEMEMKGIALNIEELRKFEKDVLTEVDEIERRVFSAGIGMVLSQDPIPANYMVMAHKVDPDFKDEGQDTFVHKGFNLPIIRENRKLPRVPTFNAGSNKQLGDLLYDHLGLQIPAGIFLKANDSGRSVDKDTLQVLLNAYGDNAPPVLKDIVEWRKLAKLQSAFLAPLQDFADPEDNYCIRTTFNQHITDTGRLSSSTPNLQQQPSRGELGERMRNLYVARPKHKLIVADFGNMELRAIAHYSRDEVYRKAFTEGMDLHALSAATQFNLPYDEILKGVEGGDVKYKQYRAIGKTSNFALSYGMGARAFKTRLLVDSGVEVSVDESQRLIEGYYATYPEAMEWKKRVIERAHKLGYVKTLTGRKRRLPMLYSHDRGEISRAERQAGNAVIQGSCADITGLALIKIHDALKPLNGYPLLVVHDEFVCEVPEEHAEEAAKIVSYYMSDYINEMFNLRVPMTADAGIGDTWGEAK